MPSRRFYNVLKRASARKFWEGSDERYVATRLRRVGTVVGGSQVRVGRQNYPLYAPTSAIFPPGTVVTVENIGSEANGVWTPVEHYGTVSSGAKTVQAGQGRTAKQGLAIRAAATRTGNFGAQTGQLAHPLNLDAARTVTVAAGVVQAESDYHRIAAESGTADDVDTINPSTLWMRDPDGVFVRSAHTPFLQLLMLQAESGHTITLKHGTGNLDFNGATDVVLVDTVTVLLFYDGTIWTDVGQGGGAASLTDLAISYNYNNSAYFVAEESVTFSGMVEAGTGTLAFALSTDGGATFTAVNFPTVDIVMAVGDVLRVTLSGTTTYKTVTLNRIA